jgi:glutaredoxin-related protein
MRSSGAAGISKLPGKLGELARKANEALGRPLADADELADRRAFAQGASSAPTAQPAPQKREQAPVIIYFIDRKDQKRDVRKLTDILDSHAIAYTVTNIEDDPAAQYAVKRDSNGARLPVVFIAGECLGGREQLVNSASSGELAKRVFG